MYYGNRQAPGGLSRGGSKVLSVLSYISILWIVGLLLGRYDSNVKFHVNQGIILTVFEVVFRILLVILHAVINIVIVWTFSMLPIISGIGVVINGLLTFVFWAATLVYMIIGVVNAITDRQKPLPIIGGFFTFVIK